MKLLSNGKFIDYNNNLFINGSKIDLNQGDIPNFHPDGVYIVPGFIDQHIHGVGGYDTMDEDENAIKEMAKLLVQEGTTSFLPTTMTSSIKDIKRSLKYIKDYQDYDGGAKILGAHLEGPFISGEFIGAQNPSHLQELNSDLIKELNQDNIIKMITYAPEFDVEHKFLKTIVDNNITPSVGHSGASCECVTNAYQNGLKCITHFHNAQSGHHHRDPGVVTAGFLEDINVELIVDKIHISEPTLKMIDKTKNSDNIILVTDAMSAKCMKDGNYELGGQKVIKKGNEARLLNGALAGSVLRLIDGVKNYTKVCEKDLSEVIKLVTTNVANNLNIDNIGEIKQGYYFDITVLDKDLNVVQTYVNGEVKYEK